jgi:uncharacterized membrane protein YwaF
LATARLRKFQQLSLRELKKLRRASSAFLALETPFLTQFRVRQLQALYFFAQHPLVPVLSPVVQFAQFWSVLESTMYFLSHSDLQTP